MFPALLQLKKSIRQVCFPHISLSETAKLQFTFVNLSHQEGTNVPGFIVPREIKQDCSTTTSPHSWQYFPPTELINRHGFMVFFCSGWVLPMQRANTRPEASLIPTMKREISGIGMSSSLFQVSKPPNKAVLHLCCYYRQHISEPSETES